MKIGFIGLGIMGSRMASHLQNQDESLIVYNRTRASAEPLIKNGAIWANSPAEVAGQVDILFTMLSTPQAVEQTAFGSNGFLDALQPGSLWSDSSTVNPSFSVRMDAEARTRKVRFVDAPVAGSKVPAEKAQLLFLVGGSEADVKILQPYYEKMGRQMIHVGEAGKGASLKLVFNLLLGINMLAFAEALSLGEAMGISQEILFDSLLNSAVAAPFVTGKRSKLANSQYDPEFPLRWMQKDLQLAAQTAYEYQLAVPAVNLAKEIYQLAARAGWAEHDFSAIYPFLSQKKA